MKKFLINSLKFILKVFGYTVAAIITLVVAISITLGIMNHVKRGEERVFYSDSYKNYAVRISTPGVGLCSGFVIDRTTLITAAHCFEKPMTQLERAFYGVQYERTKLSTVTGHGHGPTKFAMAQARVAYIGPAVDFATLEGDFSDFIIAPTDYEPKELSFNDKDRYVICGYPIGGYFVYCSTFIPRGTHYAHVYGSGRAIFGQSGGPVIDLYTGHVVGVMSSIWSRQIGGGVSILPLAGILE